MSTSEYTQDDKILMTEYLRFSSPHEAIDTQYGTIPYELYLMLEQKRIQMLEARRAVIVRRDKQVALFVNRVAGEPEEGDVWMSWMDTVKGEM